ncbi:MAG: DUF4430 domain-containing protein [Ruminococcaceae bacterium]|nr:DUF4430 domain-containing protein [Oscillospiraceae bacterium]
MKLKKILCLLLTMLMILGTSTVSLANQQIEEHDMYDVISTGIGSASAYLSEKLTEMHNAEGVTYGSDWAIITMLRGGKTVDPAIVTEYSGSLTETVKAWDATVKPTDAAKAALAFTIMDKDACDIEGVNLIELICNSERLVSGTNELAYSLLAIHASNAEIPQDATWGKDDIIEELLTFQTENGGFGLFDNETADVDMTAICVQALAPYRSEGNIATAIEKAVDFLSDTISEDWDYDDNPNTTAQVLLALASLGMDVTEHENGFGNGVEENIITSLERYRNTDGNGYLYESSVNAMATYQVMQAYDAYRKAHKDGVSYWDFGTGGQVYDDLATPEEPEPEENEADPVDVFVTIVDDGNVVTDKNGRFVGGAKVTVSDLDRNGMLTVNEALYATHEALYEGGADAGYSTFTSDLGLSLAVLWGRGTAGLLASAGYYLNNAGCWSLNDAIQAGDYLTAFNYYDANYFSDAYSYFNENTVSVQKGSSVTLTLNALGYDENWNQVASPYVGAKVEILGTDAEVLTTDADGKVEITTSQLELGAYYAVAYTDAKNIVPAVCKITITKKDTPGGGSSAPRKLNITVKVMIHGEGCGSSYTYKKDARNYEELVKAQVSLSKNKTVYDALAEVLEKEGIDFTESNGYVSEIGGLKEFDHGTRSGWMFTVDGVHKNTGCRETKLTKDCTVLWYYTDDYTKERGSDSYKEDTLIADDKPKFGLYGRHKDITYKEVINKGKTFADIIECAGKTEIETLAERGIINGKTAQSYDPQATMTRAEFATIVVNALGLPEKMECSFVDVSHDDWFAPYIKTAYHYGIVKGVSHDTFNPQGTITTEEAATMVERAAKLAGIKTEMDVLSAENVLETFEDFNSVSAWSISSMGYCVRDGILEDATTLTPKETVTREKIAVMLYRMLRKAELI